MPDLCDFCGAYVSFPCTTPCEKLQCNALGLPPMTTQDVQRQYEGKPYAKLPEPPVNPVPRSAAPLLDVINHPNHYARWKMEPVEFIAINNLPWWLANVIKYTMRYDAKDGLKDLYKARSYLDMKIREVEGHERFWDKPVREERALACSDSLLHKAGCDCHRIDVA